MNYLPIIIGAITLAGLLGGVAAFFKKGGDKVASAIDQNTIRAYKESEIVLKDQINSLRAQLQTKDGIIERLIKDGKSSRRSQR